MRLKKASEMVLTEVKWLWPGKFPVGAISILEGDPGTSKSTLLATVAAHVSKGESWPTGEKCERGQCIIANAEDPPESIILPRLIAAGADLTQVHVIVPSENDDEQFTIPDHIPALKKAIENENVRLISFDPLESFLSGNVDNRNNQQVRRALRSLETLAQGTNCSIIIVRHLTKDTSKAAIYRGGGSIGIVGGARAAVLVSRDPGDNSKCLMIPHKTSWAPPGNQGMVYELENVKVSDGKIEVEIGKVKWTGESISIDANDLLAQQEEVGSAVAAKDAIQFVRDALAEGPKSSTQLFREAGRAGVDRSAVFQASKMLGCTREKIGDDYIWTLPGNNNETIEALMEEDDDDDD